MLGCNGVSLPWQFESKLVDLSDHLRLIGVSYDGMFKNSVIGSGKKVTLILFLMLLIVWFAPNSLDWLHKDKPVFSLSDYLLKNRSELATWQYNTVFAFILALITYASILSIAEPSEFMYFQF
jgi:hypothetical protein